MWTYPDCGREFKRTNQDHYCGKAPACVDDYILHQNENIRSTLVCLKNTINNAIPEAMETIAWSMPSWKRNGYIIQFAVSTKHISVYVGEAAVGHFSDRLKEFDIYKGGIRFTFDRELPFSLISEIAGWCFEMDKTC
ncbi:MAG: DUF1801 domain-containing protein [Oscillospiraceae bacterium]|nr:DUF1801 domain-containing protein [Oscillospiraceae bacterium]